MKISQELVTDEELHNFMIRSKYSMCTIQEDPSSRISDMYSSFMFGSKSFEEKYNIISNLNSEDFLNTAKEMFSGEKYIFIAGQEDI